MPDDKRDAEVKRGFTVNDRRSASAQASATEVATASEHDPGGAPLPPIDFHTFIISLGSSVLLHLGELDPPDGGPAQVDLRLAQHTIDVIAMLEEKTRGNLTPPEAELMEGLLFDLRLRYVERSKANKNG